jgi:hypothetical protein
VWADLAGALGHKYVMEDDGPKTNPQAGTGKADPSRAFAKGGRPGSG